MPGTKRNDCHRNNHQHQFFPAGKGKMTNLSATPARRQQELQEKTFQKKNIFVSKPEHVEPPQRASIPHLINGQFFKIGLAPSVHIVTRPSFKINKAPQRESVHKVPTEEEMRRFQLMRDKLKSLQKKNQLLLEQVRMNSQPPQIKALEIAAQLVFQTKVDRLMSDSSLKSINREDVESENNGLSLSM